MDWEIKRKMAYFANVSDYERFIGLACRHVDEFDAQAWNMFITGLELVPEVVDKHKDKLKQIMSKFDMQLELPFKDSVRFVVLDSLLNFGIKCEHSGTTICSIDDRSPDRCQECTKQLKDGEL